MEQQDKIILIGAGNVAHHLGGALLKAGENLCQIYSRTLDTARQLGMRTGISYTAELNEIYPDGDIYIFCVSDDVLPSIIKAIRVSNNALLLHTSGSQPMDVFRSYSQYYGVIYPIQTFSKKRELDFREIPLCVEGNTSSVKERIKKFAEKLSDKIYEIDSAQRKELHLAAVFACNFPNYLYQVAGKLLEDKGLSFAMLRPLIFETAHKVMLLNPEEAQTGPAKRGDESIMNMHKNMLKNDKDLLKIYTILSEGIKGTQDKEETGDQKISQDIIDMPTLW
ncbi:Rossmann-like and DUF2520 domain-containing protein [Butyricimonas virosa]|uniref:Rossmann-like and DUF2520 domain-containing protein n=1 Tax=Butyricimonas virosa TaxID=544645 RepID=UPI00242D68AA|nr:Rossmann-like and DUF2520 domain-containing protein [Butyricimonas virosa]MCI7295289.1 F420-dependent NADP oxidoreductase [Butyricimonas virosa]MDY6217489.1 Rossmann-like and DUF2520 domain-containing protein [Butyricimonas virosa]